MLRRSLPILALTLVPACAPLPGDSDSEGATATEATASAGETDAPTTIEAPTTTDADTETEGDTTTEAETEGDTDTEAEPDTCPARDPAARASYKIDFGAWPEVENGESPMIVVAASCSVTGFTQVSTTVDLALSCAQDDLVDMPIKISMIAPGDFSISLLAGLEVRLAAYWQGDGHHIGEGSRFAIHDASGEVLLLAGIDLDGYSPGGHFTPLSIAKVAGACPADCGPSGCDPDDPSPRRQVLRFTHAVGGEVEIGDGGRALLGADGWSYDIVVDAAKEFSCLNCFPVYRIVIGSTPWV